MPFQSVPNAIEAVVRATYGGTPAYNVFNFRCPGGYDNSDVIVIAGLVDAWVGEALLPLVDDGYIYSATTARGLENVNDFEYVDDTNAGPGEVSGLGAFTNAAFCVTHRSGLTGRSARGRTFITGIPDAAIATNRTVNSTFSNNIVAAMNTLRTTLAIANYHLAVLSRFALGTARPEGILFDIVVSEARNQVIASQRRRTARP